MSMSSEDAANIPGLSESGSHSEWNLRMQCDRLSKELHSVKRHNQELKSAYDMSVRDYKIACDARHHAQNQLSQVKTDMESLKVHTSKVEGDNSMYKQQLIDSSHQAHHDSVAKYESNEMLNRMIDTAVERYNSLKSEMDQLRELYRSQTDDNHNMKMMYESKCNELSKDRADMQILRSQCTAVTQKWQSMGQENLELEKSNKGLKQDIEKLAKDIANLRKLKDHELAMLRREKDELTKNHNLVMSERDNVHKEIDMLTERITERNTKVSQLEHERKQMSDMIVTYRHEIQSALHDRDQAQKHMRELKECVGQMLKDPSSSSDTSTESKIWSRLLLQVSRHDRNEVNEELLGGLSVPSYDMKETPSDVHSSKEVGMLKRDIASLQKELTEAKNDAVISIKRRDWAFSERDKIVQERESIRRQCDELRRERDRAVSNHAEELRTLDELKKFKLTTSRELTEMREKLDKEERKNNLTAGSNSRDSAIDNDFQDWDTETLDFEIDISDGYHTDLGIDISYGGGDVSDSTLYINSIAKGSPCEGKLRINDVLLKVNNVDVANASRDSVMETIHAAASSTINLRVRRKKSIGRFNIPIELHLNKKDPGLQLETGVYISKILPGSSLAREGSIAVGDRVLSVNNKSVEHKTAKEVMKMIEGSGDFVVLNIGKYGVVPTDSNSNATSATGTISHGLFEKVKSKFTRSSGSEKNLSKQQPHQHGLDNSGGGTGTSKRQKPQIGTKQIQNFLSIFKGPRSTDEDEESDTIKVRTDHVMDILDKINQDHTDYDGPLTSSSSHMGTDGVDVSTHGTVTFKLRQNSKPAIPDSFVDHKQVYSNNRFRHNSGDHMNLRSDQQIRHPSYMSHSTLNPMDRMGVSGPKLSGHHTPLYEPKVQTLPTPNGSRRHITNAEKSKSLEGHVSSRGTHHGAVNDREYNKPFYPADSEVHSLDQAVKEMKDKRAIREKKPRPISLQHQFSGSRSMTPNDLGRAMPSSPSRRNRPFTPESPLSHNYPAFTESRPSSVASQPMTSSRSNSNGQMFFSAPSNPHRIVHPSCSPPPPYSNADRLYNSPSAILCEDRYHNHRDSNASPVSSYQSQTLDRKFAPGSSHIHHAVPVRSSSSTDYSTARVKFPSNHSVSSNRKSLNSNSLEIVSSGRSSPLSSPGYYNQRQEEYIRDIRSGKLKEGVLREVELDTSFDHLGITIQEQPGTGIFITSVSHNSLAAEVGIEVGDQIIEFCGINMRTARYDTAASVLKSWQSGDGKVKMKVQYNPKRCKHFPEQSNEVDKNSVTGSIQKIHAYMENIPPYQKKPLYVVHSNGSSTDESRPEPSRNIVVQRTTQEVGIRLCGGNATGVFVAEIFHESPFAGSDLQVGDQILVINGKNMNGATAEQVATELNRPSEILSIVAQHNINKYSMIHAGGDHFYVRAHFKHDAENANELSIAPGDLFLVEDSLLYGQIGKWYVCKIDERDNRVGSSGIVPSRIKMEESYSLRRSYSDVMPDEDSKTSKRNGSIGRRSFFKRRSGRHQHQRSGSKDSRELTSFSDLSTSSDNVPIADDGAPLLYQRVEKIQCSHPRPVIILGPFAQALIQKLVNESPDKYRAYDEEFLNTVNTVIEKGIADGVFVDYKKVNDLFKVTRTQTLHEISANNRHSLLMAHPSAIERMHKCKLYPIVIYIRHKSLKQIKEVKDPRFLPEHLSSRSAKELFEYFSKIEVEFKNVFTVEVQGANMAAMHQNIKRVVDEEQEKNVWL